MGNAFDRHDEEQLVGHVQAIQRHITGGMSPNDAVVKVAESYSVHPDSLPLLVQAVNTGRQSYQKTSCDKQGVSCLLQEYPLADIDEIQSRLYPSKEAVEKKAASEVVADIYRRPVIASDNREPVERYESHLDKVAVSKDTTARDRKRNNIKLAMQKELDRFAVNAAGAKDAARRSVIKLADAVFRLTDQEKQQFAYNSVYRWGDKASALLDGLGIKQAAQSFKPSRVPVAWDQAPYTLVKDAFEKSAAALEAEEELTQVKEAFAARGEQLDPFFDDSQSQSRRPGLLDPVCWELKSASLFTPAIAGISGSLAAGMKPKAPADIEAGFADQLDDPAHLDELQSIQSRAMLSDLLQNDEVISGYDPEEVTSAYNEIVQLSPSAAARAAIMRPLLRKRLTAGAMEAFDAQQLAEIEKSIQNAQNAKNPNVSVLQ